MDKNQGTKDNLDGADIVAETGAPKDLRAWLALVEADGGLRHVEAPVNADQELSAVTYLTARDEASPALMFDDIEGNNSGVRVLSNMLGASSSRFALALGLDPSATTGELIGAMRTRSKNRIAPVEVAPEDAPVLTRTLTGDDIDLTRLPAPKFWPRDGGNYIGSGDITLTRDPDSGRINMGC